MKTILFTFLTLFSLASFAQEPGEKLSSSRPAGALSVKTISQRNIIPRSMREIGMTVYVSDSTKYYTLRGGYTNEYWVAERIYSAQAGTTLATDEWVNSNFIQIGNLVYLFGDEETDGSWRITVSGDDLVFQRRESGSWVTKSTTPAAE